MAKGLIVQKYGGTSVGTPEKIKAVAARIAKLRQEGTNVVVVVSAMGHTTDELIDLAKRVSTSLPEREMDMLLSAGERISMALLSMALKDFGLEAISFTGSQAGIITDESHTRARILEIKPFRVLEQLNKDQVVIVAGFQGVSRQKEVTTLGRGGSDTTAVALAAALGAQKCEILTDVKGIYSADPRRVEGARYFKELPLDLVQEMAVQGAQVMHARSLEIARSRKMPLWVGPAHFGSGAFNGNDEKVGTMIVPSMTAESVSELPRVVAVASRSGLKLLEIPQNEAESMLEILAKHRVILHDLQSLPNGAIQIVVDPTECQTALELESPGVLAGAQDLSTIALIGYQLQQDATVTQAILSTLRNQGIVPLRLTAQSQSIKVWIPAAADLDLAVQALHAKLVGTGES